VTASEKGRSEKGTAERERQERGAKRERKAGAREEREEESEKGTQLIYFEGSEKGTQLIYFGSEKGTQLIYFGERKGDAAHLFCSSFILMRQLLRSGHTSTTTHLPAKTCFHELNRVVARLTLFEKPEDYEAFERV
jgi:hypothetical protein